tara:strand:+ start:565 stop:720 length:156 start_codon:yes stop_codon:yes gene_type:complete
MLRNLSNSQFVWMLQVYCLSIIALAISYYTGRFLFRFLIRFFSSVMAWYMA